MAKPINTITKPPSFFNNIKRFFARLNTLNAKVDAIDSIKNGIDNPRI